MITNNTNKLLILLSLHRHRKISKTVRLSEHKK